ncbi:MULTISPECIES: hypothetical protein [unclassified Halorhodospira]|uniref:hypothetical protein n=1 Tax=unclassified Halorhodospira TaxID=2626748 RepID=UPI001EE8FAF4|nr:MULTISPECIES: hypothetical protein [unclassified Halorhodospira]MCG5539867.1 hypothetical protein [Halorhodospira sp. M39old]MCG5544682.1 hypothetical protein [Halorhodospira sp. M38]
MTYNKEEVRARRMLRIAQLIYDHWEEGAGMDTRIFQVPVINDGLVLWGRSVSGGSYREHAVPRVLIRDECMNMLDNGADVEDVKERLLQYLWIVHITEEEADRLNLAHKTSMPEGWVFGKGDPFARFEAAGIELEPNKLLEPTR